MATNKNASIRYKILDQCFRNTGRQYFINNLIDECNKVLVEIDPNSNGISRRQILNDIIHMESNEGWSIDLQRIRDGKRVFFRYVDSNFSINNQPLNSAEVDQIKSALFVMSKFKGLPQFEWMDELIPVIENKLGLVGKGNNVILFDTNVDYTGLKFITPLFHAIVNQQVLIINYQDFKSENPYSFEFHPYILKQYNQRWFSFGYNPGNPDQIKNIALDRIIEIKNSGVIYKPTDIDWENDYFYDFIGVSKNEGDPVDIKIEVHATQVPYIRTKPIHGTQKGPALTKKGWIISIRVIPNYELKNLLLSYGDSIKILSPENFKNEMIGAYKKALLNYGDALI